MTLKGETRGINFFSGDILNNAGTIWHRTTKFGKITHVERGVFLWVSHAPSQGSGAPALLNFGVSFCLCTSLWCRTTKFDMVTHMGRGLVLGGQPRLRLKGAEQQRSLSIYSHTPCCRTTKFDVVTHVGGGRVSLG